ncbi:MAG: site-2 protease family protein [Acidimicrobiia bacterium]|nr:site-2 protease family protein [Acidimicrobiia bacterium]
MIHSNELVNAVLFIGVLIPSIILHEIAHGWVAERFGDRTARDAGRITLNPIPHIDPFGSLLLPGLLAFAGGPVFGYAKPVPVNPAALRQPTRHMAIVALAGPATNLLLAFVVAMVVRWPVVSERACDGFGQLVDHLGRSLGTQCLGGGEGVATGGVATRIFLAFVVVNIALAIFNVLPIPPLDGSRLLPLVLSERARIAYYRLSQYGFLLLFALVFMFRGALSFIWDWTGWIAGLLI